MMYKRAKKMKYKVDTKNKRQQMDPLQVVCECGRTDGERDTDRKEGRLNIERAKCYKQKPST